jgi:hypothetical protein
MVSPVLLIKTISEPYNLHIACHWLGFKDQRINCPGWWTFPFTLAARGVAMAF